MGRGRQAEQDIARSHSVDNSTGSHGDSDYDPVDAFKRDAKRTPTIKPPSPNDVDGIMANAPSGFTIDDFPTILNIALDVTNSSLDRQGAGYLERKTIGNGHRNRDGRSFLPTLVQEDKEREAEVQILLVAFMSQIQHINRINTEYNSKYEMLQTRTSAEQVVDRVSQMHSAVIEQRETLIVLEDQKFAIHSPEEGERSGKLQRPTESKVSLAKGKETESLPSEPAEELAEPNQTIPTTFIRSEDHLDSLTPSMHTAMRTQTNELIEEEAGRWQNIALAAELSIISVSNGAFTLGQ
ncbi:uncharacterized protein PAC_11897 [Phialocephala subalpina]|uniref:Uncharacterized protein n=1 Tax=Phialocephala subalpina TaxID=576137 RepID=A0A1L7XAE4_9HELO|nr:uncharacterized protein PAC_11897 [Phialocephala subalpina]